MWNECQHDNFPPKSRCVKSKTIIGQSTAFNKVLAHTEHRYIKDHKMTSVKQIKHKNLRSNQHVCESSIHFKPEVVVIQHTIRQTNTSSLRRAISNPMFIICHNSITIYS